MISVVLPVRNGQATLNTAIQSLYDQTLRPQNVCIVDDGSTDETSQILDAWSLRWPAVQVIRQGPNGISPALNAGVSFCLRDSQCSWIARMDADDRSFADRFERQLAIAAADDRLALIGCEVAHGGEGDFEGMRRYISWANSLHSHEELAFGLWVDSPLPHPGWMVRRDAFEAIGPYNESEEVPEDYDWLMRFFGTHHEMRAAKPSGCELLEWTESAGRLTRTHPAYSETAFNKVKAKGLAQKFQHDPSKRIFILGLGPKAKCLLPVIQPLIPALHAIVDVHPRRQGTRYRDLEVLSVERWQAQLDLKHDFALICVGTPEARDECFRLCETLGLTPFHGYLGI